VQLMKPMLMVCPGQADIVHHFIKTPSLMFGHTLLNTVHQTFGLVPTRSLPMPSNMPRTWQGLINSPLSTGTHTEVL
jgi:hypothetical protein